MLCTQPVPLASADLRARSSIRKPAGARPAESILARRAERRAVRLAVSPPDFERVLAELKDTSRLGKRGEYLCVQAVVLLAPPHVSHALTPPFFRPVRTPIMLLHSLSCSSRFVGQLVLLLGIAAPPDALDSLAVASGSAALLGGLVFLSSGTLKLGPSLSPFPEPSKGNSLVTTGPYGAVRHPMYSGLLLSAFGLSILSTSPARLALTAALFALLQVKMDAEESALAERYGGSWEAYAANTPRLVPSVSAVTEAVREALQALPETVKQLTSKA
jgi:protein-S-isoprenylcysteine O-methyltransferase Ste14